MLNRTQWFLAGAAVAVGGVLPTVAMAGELFTCPELKAAVADAPRHFAFYKGDAIAPDAASIAFEKNDKLKNYQFKNFQAKKTLTGSKTCSVAEVGMDDSKMRLRQTGYSCQYPTVFKIDKALRAQLMRCITGEVDDPSDPDDFTLWVERVSSGEGYRATEVSAQANAATGMTLWVRQSVCTNKGNGQACEE